MLSINVVLFLATIGGSVVLGALVAYVGFVLGGKLAMVGAGHNGKVFTSDSEGAEFAVDD